MARSLNSCRIVPHRLALDIPPCPAAGRIPRGNRRRWSVEDVVLIRTSALAEDARLEGTLRHAKGNQKAFRIKSVTPEEAARHGIEAVPLLEIAAPGNRVLYRGGHQRRGERPGIYSDIAIVSALMAQDAPQRLPVFGCATSSRLRGLIDPFHIKSLSFYFFGRS
jgi:hypothetical protein